MNHDMTDEEERWVTHIRERVWDVMPVSYLHYISVFASKLIDSSANTKIS